MFDYSALLWKTNHTYVKDEGNDSPAGKKEAERIAEKKKKKKDKKETKKESQMPIYTYIYIIEDMKREHKVRH